jgi:formylglycine-generating enzyme required for sulfatase activity
MPTQPVHVLQVFVSSPSDVAQHRGVVDEVIGDINDTDGQRLGVRLETITWEKMVPKIANRSAQKEIDAQTPEYDVFVGIMSSRFGTPTGRYGSGTEHEFEAARKRYRKQGRPWILFYFDEEPPTPKDLAELEQFGQVLKFKERCGGKGMYGTYVGVRGSSRGFYEQLGRHLRKILPEVVRPEPENADDVSADRVTPGKPAPAPPVAATDLKPPSDYCQRLQQDCQDVGLLGLQDREGRAICLNHVYVPLTTPRHRDESHEQDPEEMARGMGREEEKPLLLLERLDKESLYVSGPAGSGKSTFCRWVTWLACEGKIPEQPVASPNGFAEVFPESFRGRLPLLVRLRDFWKYLPDAPGGRTLSRKELEESLERWVVGASPGGLSWPCVADHLQRGALLLILDGVDEVPVTLGEEGREYHPRAMLLGGLIDAASDWDKSGNRLLVTSRPYGVSSDEERRLGLAVAPIAELAEPLGELLVRRWFHVLARDPGSGRRTAQDMLAHVAERPELEPLTSNPMLMTAMCVIYGRGGRLPQDKHELYDRMFDNVLYNRYKDDPKQIALVRKRLSVIAHGMHTGEGLGDHRATPQAEVTYDETERLIERYRVQSRATEPGYQGALAARDDLLTNSGLFLPKGHNQAGFYHLTFQDFSAAQILLEREGDLAAFFRRRGAVPEWRSTLSFVFGALQAKSTLPDRGIELLETLIKGLSLNDLALAVVVSDCLQILAGQGFGLKAEATEKFVQLCLDAIKQEVSLPERAELGLALGRLGDPRVVVDLRDHGNRQAWVEIPAGDYVYGDDKKPPRIEAPFLLSRYPVTNSQYALFIDGGGYENESLWSKDGWKWRGEEEVTEPRFWLHGKWNVPNQPVVGVSWWEAEAFAKWAGGFQPTERQWEAAARGPNGYEYPWGDDWEDGICNSREAELGATSAVGVFPRSRSADFELEDMAGNVWEWCIDQHESFATGRVFRGGCGGFGAGICRAAGRDWDGPGYRDGLLGFRVAAVPQVVPADQQAEPGT